MLNNSKRTYQLVYRILLLITSIPTHEKANWYLHIPTYLYIQYLQGMNDYQAELNLIRERDLLTKKNRNYRAQKDLSNYFFASLNILSRSIIVRLYHSLLSSTSLQFILFFVANSPVTKRSRVHRCQAGLTWLCLYK